MKGLLGLTALLQAAPLLAQATNPPYLSELPPVERVLRDITGSTADETAARRMGTFLQFKEMIEKMAGDRFYRRQLTADETRLIGVYYAAYWEIAKTKPEYQKFTGLKGFDIDPKWREELFTRYFSAAFKGKYENVEADYAQRRAARARADTQNMLQTRAEAAAAQQQMQGGGGGGGQNPGVRQLARCVASGRSESQCLSEGLVKDFRSMFGSLLPGGKGAPTGLRISGVYSSGTGVKLTFWDEHVVLACGPLVADERAYSVDLKSNQLVIGVRTSPKVFELLQGASQPVLLTMGPDGRLTGPGPTDITGRVQVGTRTWTRHYDDGRVVPMSEPVYEKRIERCNVATLALTGAAPAIGTVSEGISAVFTLLSGGEDTAGIKPAPPGLRLSGEYGSQSTFDLEFHPHAVVVGCGEAVVARSYTVQVQGGQLLVRVQHEPTPFTLSYQPNGTLVGSGTLSVNGRVIVGRNQDELAYAPKSATCAIGVIAPAGQPQPAGNGSGAASSVTPAASAGSAVLSLESGFPTLAGSANPLAGKTFLLLDVSLESAVTSAGLKVPAGTPVAKAVGAACANGMSPECQLVGTAMNSHSKASGKADANGKLQFAALPAGTYYLVGSASYNGLPILWNLKVELKPGANSVTLEQRTASPMR
jgi:hypothetical protein